MRILMMLDAGCYIRNTYLLAQHIHCNCRHLKLTMITDHQRSGVIHLSGEGLSTREIASRLGVSHSSASRIIKKFRETGSTSDRRRSGRPRATTSRDDSAIRRMAVRNPFISANEIQQELRPSATPSVHTIRRRLVGAGLRSYKPAPKPVLRPAQVKKRLLFCRQYKN